MRDNDRDRHDATEYTRESDAIPDDYTDVLCNRWHVEDHSLDTDFDNFETAGTITGTTTYEVRVGQREHVKALLRAALTEEFEAGIADLSDQPDAAQDRIDRFNLDAVGIDVENVETIPRGTPPMTEYVVTFDFGGDVVSEVIGVNGVSHLTAGFVEFATFLSQFPDQPYTDDEYTETSPFHASSPDGQHADDLLDATRYQHMALEVVGTRTTEGTYSYDFSDADLSVCDDGAGTVTLATDDEASGDKWSAFMGATREFEGSWEMTVETDEDYEALAHLFGVHPDDIRAQEMVGPVEVTIGAADGDNADGDNAADGDNTAGSALDDGTVDSDGYTHFDVGDDDLTESATGLPSCPDCDAIDVIQLSTGEYVCQDQGDDACDEDPVFEV